MAGYVAKDKSGTVSPAETAPSPRWNQVVFQKGSALSLVPDTTDAFVYMDEYVNFLVTKYGSASTKTGIKGYSLDNETSLWPSTHPRIHPNATTCAEIIQKSIALAKTVKSIDSTAEIFGPAAYRVRRIYKLPRRSRLEFCSSGQTYTWFIDYYLDKMKQAEISAGRRLLDVLDFTGIRRQLASSRITFLPRQPTATKLRECRRPALLSDNSYLEKSWIAQYGKAHLPLIPSLMNSINKYYPGTKLAFSEFTYGGEDDISEQSPMADVLGIFSKYGVYFATNWELGSPSGRLSQPPTSSTEITRRKFSERFRPLCTLSN